MSGYDGRVMLDNSAWARLMRGNLPAADGERFERVARAGRVHVCAPMLIEALYSARDSRDRAELVQELTSFDQVRCDERTWELALAAQKTLTEAPGISHRVPPIDLVIAAAADQHGLGVLHYDHDYDVIAAHAGLRFASVWVAEAGSVA